MYSTYLLASCANWLKCWWETFRIGRQQGGTSHLSNPLSPSSPCSSSFSAFSQTDMMTNIFSHKYDDKYFLAQIWWQIFSRTIMVTNMTSSQTNMMENGLSLNWRGTWCSAIQVRILLSVLEFTFGSGIGSQSSSTTCILFYMKSYIKFVFVLDLF